MPSQALDDLTFFFQLFTDSIHQIDFPAYPFAGRVFRLEGRIRFRSDTEFQVSACVAHSQEDANDRHDSKSQNRRHLFPHFVVPD